MATCTLRAASPEELDGPNAELVRVEVVNPCSHVVSAYIGVTRRNGAAIDLAVNVQPGHTFVATSKALAAYGVGTRYTFTSSYGSGTSAAVASSTVIVVGTFGPLGS